MITVRYACSATISREAPLIVDSGGLGGSISSIVGLLSLVSLLAAMSEYSENGSLRSEPIAMPLIASRSHTGSKTATARLKQLITRR
jgi:hypothetical protein